MLTKLLCVGFHVHVVLCGRVWYLGLCAHPPSADRRFLLKAAEEHQPWI